MFFRGQELVPAADKISMGRSLKESERTSIQHWYDTRGRLRMCWEHGGLLSQLSYCLVRRADWVTTHKHRVQDGCVTYRHWLRDEVTWHSPECWGRSP